MPKLSTLWVFGLFFLPIFSISGIPFPYIYPKMMFLQIWTAFGLLVFSFKYNADEEAEFGFVQLGFIALLVLGFASLTYTPDKVVALFGPFWRGTGLVFYFASLFTVLVMKEIKLDRQKVALATIIIGVIVSVVLIFIGGTQGIFNAMKAIMGNPNASSLWIGFFMILNYQFSKIYEGKSKYISYAVYAVGFASLMVLGSRSAIGGVLLAFFIIGMLSDKRAVKFSLISGCAITLVLIAQFYLMKQSILRLVIDRSSNFSGSRGAIWEGAWESFLAKPFLGYGFHGLIQGYWENYTPRLGTGMEWNDNAHSVVLNVAAELGIIGLIILLVSMFFIGKNVIEKEGKVRAGWVGMMFYMAIYAFVQPYYIDSVFTVVVLLYLFNEKVSFKVNLSNKLYRGVKVVSAIGLLYVTYIQYCQLSLINQTRYETVKQRSYRKVWNRVMDQTPYLDTAGSILEINNQVKQIFRPGAYKNLAHLKGPFSSFMVDSYARIIDEHSHRPRLLENYSSWLVKVKKPEKALVYIDKVIERSDRIPRAYTAKAGILMKMKRYSEAKQLLLKVKKLNPNFKDIDRNLAILRNF